MIEFVNFIINNFSGDPKELIDNYLATSNFLIYSINNNLLIL